MELTLPSWFKYRQGKAEPSGSDMYRLTAPNVPEAFITIRRSEKGAWSAALRLTAAGPDVAVTEPMFETTPDAWSAAFELYRNHVVL